MSSHCQFFGKGSIMSVELKRMERNARAKRPDMFATRTVHETSMDGEGRVTTTERQDVKAIRMSPSARHRLSLQTDRH